MFFAFSGFGENGKSMLRVRKLMFIFHSQSMVFTRLSDAVDIAAVENLHFFVAYAAMDCG